jgi:hypothetical protein
MNGMDHPPAARPGEPAAPETAAAETLLDADAAEVLRRELYLLKPAARAESDAVLALLHTDFTEIGTSGRFWDRPGVAEALVTESQHTDRAPDGPSPPAARVTGLACARLAVDVIQVTYTLQEPERTCRRTSVWIRERDGPWLLRFHQSTPVTE